MKFEFIWYRGEKCQNCGGSGKTQDDSDCENCKGEGAINIVEVSTNEMAKFLADRLEENEKEKS